MLSLLVIFVLLQKAFSLEVLFVSIVIGKSHMDFSSSLIEKLTRKNHTVDYILGFMNSDVKNAGKHTARQAVEVHFPKISPWNSNGAHLKNPFSDLEQALPIFESWNFFQSTSLATCDLILASPEVHRLLTTNKYDLLVGPGYEFCSYGLAKRYNLPLITCSATAISTMVMDTASGVPQLPIYENEPVMSSFRVDLSSFYDRFMHYLRILKFKYVDFRISAERYTAMFRKHYGQDFPDAMELTKLASLELINSNYLVEVPRPIAYRTKYIGGINLRKAKKLDKSFDAILNKRSGGAVLISFGTQVRSEAYTPAVISAFTTAFKKYQDITFIWKYLGPAVGNESNIVTLDWLPQTDLLYDRRVVGFISHVGMNSLTEAAFAGVPLIAIPMFADQNYNSRLVESRGIGVRVRKTNITADSMNDALHAILRTPGYRENSKKLAKMLAATPETAERTFVEAVEFAAQFKDLGEHLRLSAANYPLYVHYGYDIVLTIAAFSLLLIYLSFVIVRHSLSKAISLHKKQKDE